MLHSRQATRPPHPTQTGRNPPPSPGAPTRGRHKPFTSHPGCGPRRNLGAPGHGLRRCSRRSLEGMPSALRAVGAPRALIPSAIHPLFLSYRSTGVPASLPTRLTAALVSPRRWAVRRENPPGAPADLTSA